jgi:AcrR family transcriptional regulator
MPGMSPRKLTSAATTRRAPTEPAAGDLVGEWWSTETPPAARTLLLSAIDLFAEQGYHATTTRDIVTRAGMSTGAMYAHFGSKEELLFEISLIGHRRGLESLLDASAASVSPAERLAALVRAFTVYHARFHSIATIVHHELSALSAEHLAQVLDVRHQTTKLIEGVLTDGVRAGAFSVPDTHAVGQAVLSLCVDVARWYDGLENSTPEQVGQLNAQLALRMVAAAPGQSVR